MTPQLTLNTNETKGSECVYTSYKSTHVEVVIKITVTILTVVINFRNIDYKTKIKVKREKRKKTRREKVWKHTKQ